MSSKRKTTVRQRKFHDDNLRLEALTHKSYHYENPQTGPHNERLEFLGDSIVSFVVANYLFGRFPQFKEGQLTLLRANLVCKKKLAQFALQLGLDSDIRLGVGALRDGGRASEKVLEDAFEAYIGAVFLDSNSSMEEVQKFMEPLLAPAVDELTRCSPNSAANSVANSAASSIFKQKFFRQDNSNAQLIADQILNSDLQDPINKLQTWSQRRGMGIPIYKPYDGDHNAVFTVGVIINNKCYGHGRAKTKRMQRKKPQLMRLNKLPLMVSITILTLKAIFIQTIQESITWGQKGILLILYLLLTEYGNSTKSFFITQRILLSTVTFSVDQLVGYGYLL